MRLEPTTGAGLDTIRSLATQQSTGRPPEGTRSVGNLEDSSFVPTNDLLNLLNQVRELPESRPEVVKEASDALARGDLLSPESILQTAESILNAEQTDNV